MYTVNIVRKNISKNRISNGAIRSSYGFYIGFKATVVIEQESAMPVAIIIHAGAPHDSKIFSEIMDNLQKRRIIRKYDTILLDRGYYSYNNYQIGIPNIKSFL